jgi:L,D-transpeptidase YcbB
MKFIMKSIAATILLISSFLLSPLPAVSQDRPSPAGTLLQHWFTPFVRDAAQDSIDPRSNPVAALARFYRCRGYKPSWINAEGPLPQTTILLEAIRSAPGDGLPVTDSGIGDLAFDPRFDVLLSDGNFSAFEYNLARLDVALTAAMLQYAAQLSQGCIRPEGLAETDTSHGMPSIRDLPGELAHALNENRLENFVRSLSPPHRAYRELKRILNQYRRIQVAGGWPLIDAGPPLKIGDPDARVTTLRRHLEITGDLQVDSRLAGDRFDLHLEAAVKRFQRRHGLEPDGIVGAATRRVLNIPIENRIIQLMLNMERWRWYPNNMGSRYVMVNIPGFELQLVENEAAVLTMRAIVGRVSRPTPILSSRLTYLKLNPFWNIPQEIARQDLLPKIQADPEFLDRKGIRVFDSWQEDAPALDPYGIGWSALSKDHFPYRLQQQPAADNALGRIKFMFPNRQSVYIHDTPGKSLFNRPQRLFSSGCVRVENPLVLAQYLLSDQRWTRRRLALAVDSGQSRTIILQTPVPVYLVYFTAWTNADGRVQFRDDVYGRDRRLLLAFMKAEANLYFCSANIDGLVKNPESRRSGVPRSL